MALSDSIDIISKSITFLAFWMRQCQNENSLYTIYILFVMDSSDVKSIFVRKIYWKARRNVAIISYKQFWNCLDKILWDNPQTRLYRNMGLWVTILGGFRGRRSLNLKLPSPPTHDQPLLLTFTFGVTGNVDSEGDPILRFLSNGTSRNRYGTSNTSSSEVFCQF